MPPFFLLLLLGGAYTIVKNKGQPSTSPQDPSKLYLSKDCKHFHFGDKTGDKWWKNTGSRIANNIIKKEAGSIDSLDIAFRTLSDWQREDWKEDNYKPENQNKCFMYPFQDGVWNGFPMLEFGDLIPDDIGIYNQKQLAYKRIEWIQNNPPMWNLLWQIRNRIDKEFFEGIETVELDKDYNIITGKNFSYQELWDNFLESMLSVAFSIEEKNQGRLLPWLTDKDIDWHVTLFAMRILFPNMTKEQFKKWSSSGKISQSELFQNILASVDNLTDNDLDI